MLKMLSDTRLQAVLNAIVTSENPRRVLDNVLESNPEFAEFATKLLQSLGLVDEDGVFNV
jgi:hypothetical protein